jgi:hypothetical protein
MKARQLQEGVVLGPAKGKMRDNSFIGITLYVLCGYHHSG